jgi:vacuolar-type H+-ATPase subunit E/Vma4
MNNLYASLEKQYGLPDGLLSAVESVESHGNTKAVSPKGAKGNFQFMPETATAYGVDTSDPISSARGAAQFLSDLTNKYGSIQAALAHYNGGTNAAKAVLAGNEPPANETKNYLTKINAKLQAPEDLKWESLDGVSAAPADLKWTPIEENKKEIPDNLKNLSNTELFLKGLKSSAETTATGIGQVLDPLAQKLEETFPSVSKLGEKLGLPTAKEVAANREAQIVAQREANKPLLETSAGLAGNITGELGQAVLLPGGTIGKAALAGGAMGAAQPTLSEESRAFNILSGAGVGAAGQGIVNALGRVAQPITNQLGEIGQNAVDTLRKAGVPLDAAQATGSALLARVKAALSDNPVTVGAQQEFSGLQKQAFNKAVSKTMGEDATHITPEIIEKAKERIGNIYDDIASRVNIQTDETFKNALNQINDDALHTLEDSQYNIIKKNIDDVLSKSEKNNGFIDATQYKNLKMRLDKLSKNSNSDVAQYGRDLRDLLNKGLSDSAEFYGNKADVDLLKSANKQWGNMRKIEDVAIKSEYGDISPSMLFNSLTTKGKRNAFYAEDNELAKLASAGKIVLPEKLPNSGTVARLAAQAALPAAGAAIYGAYQGDWKSAAEGAALGIAAPKLAQAAINNPKFAAYLEKGIGQTALSSLIRAGLQAPAKYGVGKIPLASYESYLQQVQKEKGSQ